MDELLFFRKYNVYKTIYNVIYYQNHTQKKVNSRNKNKGIRVSQLAKIPTLFPDWWRLLNYKG